jgi:hypothetical protein
MFKNSYLSHLLKEEIKNREFKNNKNINAIFHKQWLSSSIVTFVISKISWLAFFS